MGSHLGNVLLCRFFSDNVQQGHPCMILLNLLQNLNRLQCKPKELNSDVWLSETEL